jgi:hypothetical protein
MAIPGAAKKIITAIKLRITIPSRVIPTFAAGHLTGHQAQNHQNLQFDQLT